VLPALLPGAARTSQLLALPLLGVSMLDAVWGFIREIIFRPLRRRAIGPPPGRVRSRADSPDMLPSDIPEFTGRDGDLNYLRELVQERGPRPAPIVATIHGAPGTGKSVLAAHFAREMESEFPDGRLYVDLRGTSPRPLEPMEPVEALDRLLRGLGVAGPDLPADLDGLTREYRGNLGGKRAIVVLDNAKGESQVRPLLPNSATCMVLITSRQPLDGLISSSRRRLEVMSPGDSVALLGRIAGDRVVSGENAAMAQRLAGLCSHVPLALSIAGVQLRNNPIEDVVTRLADERNRLRGLHVGNASVKASLDVTYDQLPEHERRLFRRLRLLPESSFGAELAGVLLGCSTRDAQDVLDRLVEEQVLERAGAGRYGFNELIGLYAQEKLEREEPESERRAASERALRVYLLEAVARAALLDPAILELDGAPPSSPPAMVALAEQVAALDWFERERPRLARVWRSAAEIGAHEVVWKLAACLVPFFDLRGHRTDWAELQKAALQAARESGDLYARTWARLGRGQLRWLDRRHGEDALSDLEEALESARAGGWPRLQARALYLMGHVAREAQRAPEALVRYNRGAAIFHEEGMVHQQASTIFYVGLVLHGQGAIDPDDAQRLGGTVLTALAAMHNGLWVLRTVGRTKEYLAVVAEGLGDHELAGSLYIGSNQAFREIGFRHGQARVLHSLGRMRRAQNREAFAREFLEEALALYEQAGDSAAADEVRLLLDP
jgi:hypothetical protein